MKAFFLKTLHFRDSMFSISERPGLPLRNMVCLVMVLFEFDSSHSRIELQQSGSLDTA